MVFFVSTKKIFSCWSRACENNIEWWSKVLLKDELWFVSEVENVMMILFQFCFVSECNLAFADVTRYVKVFTFCWVLCFFSYQKSFFSVFLKNSIWSLITSSFTCLNYSNSLVTRKNFDIRCVKTRSSRSLIKFVTRLFVHIFSRSLSNLEHFSSICCIVCFDNS